MCMQGFDSKRVIALIIICSPFIAVGCGAVMVGKGVKHAASSVVDAINHPRQKGRKRDRLKAKVTHIKDKVTSLIPDEEEQKFKQLKKLYEDNKGSEEGAYFGIQLAVAHYYLREEEDQATELIDEAIKLLETEKKENKITYKGNKTLLFAYYLAASMANDDCNYDDALKNFDSAVQQWMILDSTPVGQKTAWAVHAFENRDFHKPRKCQVCEKTLFGKSRHGLECKVCGCIVHPRCVVDVATPCNFTPNNNQNTGLEALLSAQIGLASLLNSRGLAYYYAGHYDKALNDFDALINNLQKNNNEETADEKLNMGLYYANRALVHFYKKNLESAIADTTTAIAHGFVNAQVYTIRASALQLRGRVEEAQQDRKKARECDPSAPLEVFPYELPMELIITVFSFLQPRDLAHAAQTCKLWKQIVNDHTSFGFLSKLPDHYN